MQKLEFFLRRLGTSLFVLVGVSIITFFLARVVPADPAALYIGPKARTEDIERVTKQLGLDKPLPVQYVIYMQELFHGDLGNSISTKRPITQELADRIPATMELLFSGMFLAVLIGVPLGARSQGKPLDLTVRTLSIVGVSMPAFFLGLIFQIVFFRNLHLLPLAGRVNVDLRFTAPLTKITDFILLDSLLTSNWVTFKDAFLHLILPSLTLAAYPIGLIARMTRAAMLEVLEQDYIRTARAYGIRHLSLRLEERHQPHANRRRPDLCLRPHRYLLCRDHLQLARAGNVHRALAFEFGLSRHHGHDPLRCERIRDDQSHRGSAPGVD
jgi:ABC-type dipeptide/oligopeptide/nickel transport system permease component